ncbi:hypothetical protein IAI10_16435 [Clostridium sp. 19966]|uniref:hypothetical protein n=1 Tax=Clostridium sp. 19966 TaxID=2768166 RepID=UPI0028DFCF53|nr:hypothetical protein [Clostridium sp. 19966]MDT8718256.1 hypothetical protein [Clostridium sp. 19966]
MIEEKEILKEKLLDNGLKIILARWIRKELNNKKQYVTWLLNPQTNKTYNGNYYSSLKTANNDYLKRNA